MSCHREFFSGTCWKWIDVADLKDFGQKTYAIVSVSMSLFKQLGHEIVLLDGKDKGNRPLIVDDSYVFFSFTPKIFTHMNSRGTNLLYDKLYHPLSWFVSI